MCVREGGREGEGGERERERERETDRERGKREEGRRREEREREVVRWKMTICNIIVCTTDSVRILYTIWKEIFSRSFC